MNRIKTATFLLLATVWGLVVSQNPAIAQSAGWKTHLDASLISEILLVGDELYIAGSGGLIIYDTNSRSVVDQFKNTDGLPANFLTSLVFDAAGELWVGMEDSGIARVRFAGGGRLDVLPLNATFNGLSSDNVTSLAAWGDTLFYGTKNGAGLILQGFPGQRWFDRDGLPSNVVNDVVADNDRMWVATDSGTVYIDRLGFLNNATSGLPAIRTLALVKTDTTVWVGTSAGVARFDDTSGQWIDEALNSDVFHSLRFDGTTLWAGSRARVYQNSGSGWTSQAFFEVFASTAYGFSNVTAEVDGLQPMPDGTVYCGTGDPNVERRGTHLLLLDGTSFENIVFDGLPENRVNRIEIDGDNSPWVGSVSFGVGKLTPQKRWHNYNPPSGPNELSSILQNLTLVIDDSDVKWFCGLSRPGSEVPLDELRDQLDTNYNNDQWFHRGIGADGGDGLGSLRNVRGRLGPNNTIYLVSDNLDEAAGWWGLNILDPTRSLWLQVNPTSTGGGMTNGNLTDVAFGESGSIFVLSKDTAVQQWDPKGFDWANLSNLTDDFWFEDGRVGTEFDTDATLQVLAVRPTDKTLYVGTSAGLYRRLDPRNYRHVPANRGFGAGLLGNNVRDIAFDNDGNVWVATDLGLNRLAADNDFEIESFTTPIAWQTQLNLFFPPDVVSPLVNATCRALAFDPVANLLYIGTSRGLSVLDLTSLQPSGTDLSQVYLYPNPVKSSSGHTSLKVGNIDSPVNVDIYTLDGELVHQARNVLPSDPVVWDLKTKSGLSVSSGVYLVRINDDSGTVVKSVSVLR